MGKTFSNVSLKYTSFWYKNEFNSNKEKLISKRSIKNALILTYFNTSKTLFRSKHDVIQHLSTKYKNKKLFKTKKILTVLK